MTITETSCLLLLLAFSAAVDARSILGTSCHVSIDYRKGDLKEPQPLLLTDAEEPTFLLPKEHRLLVIPANSSILLVCPGKNNSLVGLPGSKQQARATCLGGKDFLVESEVRPFANLTCQQLPKETVRKIAGSPCLEDGHDRYEIGFAIDRQHFIPLMEICRDATTLRTYYSKYAIPKEISSYQSQYPRPYWKYGSWLYPGYNMNYVFKAEVQVTSMTLLLGSEEQARKFIRPGDQQYLNRGHLAAKADFIYGSQQTATFQHLNTAAQWASFNSGNWMIVESAVRNLAARRQLDLLVYTGVHGITSLPDVRGVDQPLYLFVNATEKAFPVPRFYWKIIHDPVGNRATAFVGLNEPYARNITKDMYLCPDISEQEDFSWITWSPRDIEKGVSYVCSVEELRKSVPTIPALGETGLLV